MLNLVSHEAHDSAKIWYQLSLRVLLTVFRLLCLVVVLRSTRAACESLNENTRIISGQACLQGIDCVSNLGKKIGLRNCAKKGKPSRPEGMIDLYAKERLLGFNVAPTGRFEKH